MEEVDLTCQCVRVRRHSCASIPLCGGHTPRYHPEESDHLQQILLLVPHLCPVIIGLYIHSLRNVTLATPPCKVGGIYIPLPLISGHPMQLAIIRMLMVAIQVEALNMLGWFYLLPTFLPCTVRRTCP